MTINITTSQTISWLRYNCAFAVVIIHAFGSPISGTQEVAFQQGLYDSLRILFSQCLCRAAVPIFLIISGYLFFTHLDSWDTSLWFTKIKKRIRSLLIPYLLWNIISIVFSYLKIVIVPSDLELNLTIADFYEYYQQQGGILAFWDRGVGSFPHNYPLHFIRDLMVVIVCSPVIYYLVRNFKLYGVCILYVVYLIQSGDLFPGFSTEAFVFFSFGAYLNIHKVGLMDFFNKYRKFAMIVAIPLLFIMFFTYGNDMKVWHVSCKLFQLFGALAIIGFALLGISLNLLVVDSRLVSSAFILYAGHGTIILPTVQFILDKLLPNTEIFLMLSFILSCVLTIILLIYLNNILYNYFPKLYSILTGGRSK